MCLHFFDEFELHQVVSLKLVTPAFGTITLSREEFPRLFRMAVLGLGALGVVVELTIQVGGGRTHHSGRRW
jgi:hypothetical protein